jgi:hypothetical protein
MSDVAEKSIMFYRDMFRAVIEDRKTETRRLIKPQPPAWLVDGRVPWNIHDDVWGFAVDKPAKVCRSENTVRCPYGKPGDILIAREDHSDYAERPCHHPGCWSHVSHPCESCGRSWGSVRLEVLDVKVEQVQDITPEACIAEGIRPRGDSSSAPFNAEHDFRALWDSIYDERVYGWDVNPWEFAITFRRL